MDPELREYLDQRFGEIDKRIEGVETTVRQTNVVVEDLRGQIQLVAEGVANVDGKLERFREEQAKEHKETRTQMRLLYQPGPSSEEARKAPDDRFPLTTYA